MDSGWPAASGATEPEIAAAGAGGLQIEAPSRDAVTFETDWIGGWHSQASRIIDSGGEKKFNGSIWAFSEAVLVGNDRFPSHRTTGVGPSTAERSATRNGGSMIRRYYEGLFVICPLELKRGFDELDLTEGERDECVWNRPSRNAYGRSERAVHGLRAGLMDAGYRVQL